MKQSKTMRVFFVVEFLLSLALKKFILLTLTSITNRTEKKKHFDLTNCFKHHIMHNHLEMRL